MSTWTTGDEGLITPTLDNEAFVRNATARLWFILIGLFALKVVVSAIFYQVDLSWITILCIVYVFITTPYYGGRGDLLRLAIKAFKYALVGNVFWTLVWYTLATRV